MEDPIVELIAEFVRQLNPSDPLYATAAKVLSEAADTLDPDTIDALQATGFAAVKAEGEPPFLPVPDVMALIAAGEEEFDPDKMSEQSLSRLAVLGFCALAAEDLIEADPFGTGGKMLEA